MKKNTLVVLLSLFCTPSMGASIIKGKVVALKDKQPIGYVSVVLLASDSSYVAGIQTDSTGFFDLKGEFPHQNYFLKLSSVGYNTTFIQIVNPQADMDLGEITLDNNSFALGQVTVTGNQIINRVDRQIIVPSSIQTKSSINGFDLLGNMNISRLRIDQVNQTVKIGTEEVQLRINGVRAEINEVVSLRPQDIVRIEFFEDTGVRYGSEGVGAVLNVIVNREKQSGGYIAINGHNAPYVGFGNNNLTFKTNYKASEFGLNYDVNYRSYGDRWANSNEKLNIPGNVIEREKQGIQAPMRYDFHRINLSYNLTKTDDYVFNVVLRNQINGRRSTNKYENIYSYMPNSTFERARSKGDEYIPALDIYFKKEFKNKQSISANVVGTYIGSNNRNWYTEEENNINTTSIHNKTNGSKYSIIGELVYEKQFDKMTFSSGGKYTQGYANNKYLGNTVANSKMNNSDTYLFAQLQGKIGEKFSYTIGVGGSRVWFKEKDKDKTYYLFRPSLQLSYKANDNLTFKNQFTIWTNTPSLGQLSDIEQQVDAYQIKRGNPNLKPYNTYRNRFEIIYSRGMFDISSTFGYMYFHKLIANTYSVENDKIVSYMDNHKQQHYLFLSLNTSLKLIKDIWTVSSYVDLHRDIFNSNSNNTTAFGSIYWNLNSNLLYKKWTMNLHVSARFKDLWGEYISYGQKWSNIEIGRKHKEASLALGLAMPFDNKWSAGGKNTSHVKPGTSWSYIAENGRMIYLRFSWNFSFGRKHNAGQKTMDNSDSDKGIL